MNAFARGLLAAVTMMVVQGLRAADAMLIEAEDFQFYGAWTKNGDTAASGRAFLLVSQDARDGRFDAVTRITLDADAEYAFWVRSRDFAHDRPKTRRFALRVNNVPFEKEAGTHGREGFAWQLLGKRTLAAGDHLLSLHDTARNYGRCDAIFITRTDKDPGTLSGAQLSRLRVRPKTVLLAGSEAFNTVAVDCTEAKTLARLETPVLRVTFAAGRDPQGKPWIVRRTRLLRNGAWVELPDAAGDETLFVQYAADARADLRRVALWKGSRTPIRVTLNDVTIETSSQTTDPYAAAPACRFVPRVLLSADAASVELRYESADGEALPVRWSIDPDDPYTLRVQARLTAKDGGSYALGFSAFTPTAREQVAFVQLPPLYQFQRLPETADLLCNTLTPHPLALAQVPWLADGAPLSVVVAAEPADLPFEWPNATNAVCGFSLLNSRAQVQPAFFSPVLGSPCSYLAAGETRLINWRVMTRPADWKETLEACCLNILKVTDYREPLGASLTDAVLNMTDLMMNDEFGGWNSHLRGFYDIESATMGKHAAPLVLLSAALLSRSETFWQARTLPTLEFLLSRRGSDILQSGTNRVGQPVKQQIAIPGTFYGTTCWEGALRLTGGLNPWLREFALPEGKFRHARSYNSSAPWTEMLAAHRLAPGLVRLDAVTADANEWLAQAVYGRQTQPIDFSAFYNISFYPYWWDVVDLFEATGDTNYLAAAVEGAYHTVAGQWSHPRIPAGEVTVHPDGSQVTYHRIWHKNDQLFRLGWPRQPNDTPTRRVPAWQVSPVGLGLEQPSTYTAFNGAMNNIMQSTWAPHLLRVFRHTNRTLFRTFARNSVIGRFANYPGYYLTCFTDLVHDPRYPYTGPDITSIYYHHIPVHYAFAMDYLVADAEARSGGQVVFPWVKQKNYAWFNNRVYTAEPGTVYSDRNAVLWLERGLVTTDLQTDWLAARSPDRFWVILMNQTRARRTVRVQLDTAKSGVTAGDGLLFEGNADPFQAAREATARPAPALQEGAFTVEIAPLSMVTVGYPAATRTVFPASQPLASSHRTAAAGTFGAAHAFTIRSPWGKDAVYAVLTADPIPGARVVFTCDGQTRVCERFPYEASFYPVSAPGVAVRIVTHLPGQPESVIALP